MIVFQAFHNLWSKTINTEVTRWICKNRISWCELEVKETGKGTLDVSHRTNCSTLHRSLSVVHRLYFNVGFFFSMCLWLLQSLPICLHRVATQRCKAEPKLCCTALHWGSFANVHLKVLTSFSLSSQSLRKLTPHNETQAKLRGKCDFNIYSRSQALFQAVSQLRFVGVYLDLHWEHLEKLQLGYWFLPLASKQARLLHIACSISKTVLEWRGTVKITFRNSWYCMRF